MTDSTVYYHTILLTFRPFLIIRGRWQRDMKRSARGPGSGAANRPNGTPSWLNEACANALNCAIRTIRHLCEAASVNELARVCMPLPGFYPASTHPECRKFGITDSSWEALHSPSSTILCTMRVWLLLIFHGYMLVSGVYPQCALGIPLRVPCPPCRPC